MNDLGERFGGLEKRMGSLEERMGSSEERMDKRMDDLERRLFVRLDRIESEVKLTHFEFYDLRADFRELRGALKDQIPALKI
jgi:hypothetical protein